jgi:hypothetical protein
MESRGDQYRIFCIIYCANRPTSAYINRISGRLFSIRRRGIGRLERWIHELINAFSPLAVPDPVDR